MERSAEFWLGADWQWVHGATRAQIAEELAAAEAREAGNVVDRVNAAVQSVQPTPVQLAAHQIPEVIPGTRDALSALKIRPNAPNASKLPAVSDGGVQMSGNTTDAPTAAEVIAACRVALEYLEVAPFEHCIEHDQEGCRRCASNSATSALALIARWKEANHAQ